MAKNKKARIYYGTEESAFEVWYNEYDSLALALENLPSMVQSYLPDDVNANNIISTETNGVVSAYTGEFTDYEMCFICVESGQYNIARRTLLDLRREFIEMC